MSDEELRARALEIAAIRLSGLGSITAEDRRRGTIDDAETYMRWIETGEYPRRPSRG